jgi:hypothetical protein
MRLRKGALATKQSIVSFGVGMDCFASLAMMPEFLWLIISPS